jgi:protein-S-isoprenylcysteine O-methyltransferase Ste14
MNELGDTPITMEVEVKMDKKEELKIDLLFKECDSVGQAIRNFSLLAERISALGLAVIAAGLAYGIKEKINEILLFLPFAFFLVMLYGIHILTEGISLGGYKRHLEGRINNIFGEHLLLWELFIAKERHGSFARFFLSIAYLLFLVCFGFLSLKTALQNYTKSTFVFMLIGILFSVVILIISYCKMNRAFDRVYQIAKKQSKQNIVIATSPNTAQKE